MRTLWQTIAHLTWALWLGGLIALFIFVTTLFHQDRALAVHAAPRLFHAFEIYQLILAAAAIVSTLLWRKPALLAAFVIVAAGAVISPVFITPQIDRLQRLNQTHTPEFVRLHGEAMIVYTADSVVLLITGLIMPRALKRG